jgi:hypothetical protein
VGACVLAAFNLSLNRAKYAEALGADDTPIPDLHAAGACA